MKRKCILFVVIVAILLCFSSCGTKYKYDADEVVGLTSIQIVEKYGNFDRSPGYPNEDGLYCNVRCGYLITPASKGCSGSPYPEYFMIYFDENGVATLARYEQTV